MAASKRQAKAPVGKKTPRAKHFDTLASAEKLVGARDDRHYVAVPIDDPNTQGNYTAKGYEVEMYTDNGVRFGGEKIASSMYGKPVTRRGCVLMSKLLVEKEAEDREALAEFDEMYRQVHVNRQVKDAPELGMVGSGGEAIVTVENETTPLLRNAGV